MVSCFLLAAVTFRKMMRFSAGVNSKRKLFLASFRTPISFFVRICSAISYCIEDNSGKSQLKSKLVVLLYLGINSAQLCPFGLNGEVRRDSREMHVLLAGYWLN